jgi:hypothetical protein
VFLVGEFAEGFALLKGDASLIGVEGPPGTESHDGMLT